MSGDQQKYTNKLRGKRILILGGTSGIGYAVAEAVLEHGAGHVVISSSNADRVKTKTEALKAAYPSRTSAVSGFQSDLGDETKLEDSILAVLNFATADGADKLDHIVLTAGDKPNFAKLSEATIEQMKHGSTIRMLAPLMLAKHVSKFVNAGPGSSITFTTGASSQKPIKGWLLPSVWFGAHHTLTTGLALELAPLRVNIVSPGPVDTELWISWGFTEEQKQKQEGEMRKSLLTRRIPGPEPIAEAYLYLFKDENITGTCISTNGGSLLS